MGLLGDLFKGTLEKTNDKLQKKYGKNKVPQIEYQNEAELERFANSGNIDAIGEMTTIYFNQMDYDNAVYWAKKGAASNDGWCMYILGLIAYETGNYAECENWHIRNVNTNDYSLSGTELGFMYLNLGNDPNFITDMDKAHYYFEKAYKSNASNGNAALGLAMCLMDRDDSDGNEIKKLLQVASRNATGDNKELADRFLSEIP